MNASLKMAAEKYLSRRIPDLRVGNNIDKIDKKPISSSIHPCRPLGPWGGAKRSNIIKSEVQSHFQRFLNQTLCIFSQMKDI